MKLKSLSIFVFTIGLFYQPVFCFASSLTLKIESPTKTYKIPSQFELLITFHNISDKPFIVFPAHVRRKYTPLDGQNVRFNPYPGPAIDPWRTAIVLKPGEIKTTTFKGMRNGDGDWHLEPGRYELCVTLYVATTSSFETQTNKYKGIDIWRGNAASESIKIHYLK
jgi:hypothetical protein